MRWCSMFYVVPWKGLPSHYNGHVFAPSIQQNLSLLQEKTPQKPAWTPLTSRCCHTTSTSRSSEVWNPSTERKKCSAALNICRNTSCGGRKVHYCQMWSWSFPECTAQTLMSTFVSWPRHRVCPTWKQPISCSWLRFLLCHKCGNGR